MALGRLRKAGYLLVAVSNQPAAAKGVVTIERLRAVQERVLDLLRREGVVPDAIRCCFHHPEATVPDQTGRPTHISHGGQVVRGVLE